MIFTAKNYQLLDVETVKNRIDIWSGRRIKRNLENTVKTCNLNCKITATFRDNTNIIIDGAIRNSEILGVSFSSISNIFCTEIYAELSADGMLSTTEFLDQTSSQLMATDAFNI